VDAAELVYKDNPIRGLQKAGLDRIAFYNTDNTQAMVCADDQAYYITYRGTDEFSDTIDDVKYVKTDFPCGGRVHTGFYDYYKKVESQIAATLKTLDSRPRIVCGHSLGGVALMAGVTFKAEAGYFFGSPRIGNYDFVARVEFPVWRFEHFTDPVTYTPPRQSPWQSFWALSHFRWPTLYAHAGVAIPLDGDLHRMIHYRKSIKKFLQTLG